MKKIIIMGGILLTVVTSQLSTYGAEPPNEPTKIIDTVDIPANPVILAASKVHKTSNWDENTSDSTITISQSDAQMLMKIAVAEAGNQGVTGQKKVIEVVYNRAHSNSNAFPDSIADVISQPAQFESYSNGSYAKAVPTPETHQALAEFEKNLNADRSIIAFETTENHGTLEKYFTYCYTCGDHDFYTFKQ